jgi:hypothetical protein
VKRNEKKQGQHWLSETLQTAGHLQPEIIILYVHLLCGIHVNSHAVPYFINNHIFLSILYIFLYFRLVRSQLNVTEKEKTKTKKRRVKNAYELNCRNFI